MDIPSVKRLIAKYHEANVSLRRKAVEADKKANEKVFREKRKRPVGAIPATKKGTGEPAGRCAKGEKR